MAKCFVFHRLSRHYYWLNAILSSGHHDSVASHNDEFFVKLGVYTFHCADVRKWPMGNRMVTRICLGPISQKQQSLISIYN